MTVRNTYVNNKLQKIILIVLVKVKVKVTLLLYLVVCKTYDNPHDDGLCQNVYYHTTDEHTLQLRFILCHPLRR